MTRIGYFIAGLVAIVSLPSQIARADAADEAVIKRSTASIQQVSFCRSKRQCECQSQPCGCGGGAMYGGGMHGSGVYGFGDGGHFMGDGATAGAVASGSYGGHYRYPYYSYRAPWYFHGPAVYNLNTGLTW